MSIWPAALRRVTLPCIWNTVENPPFACRGLLAEAVRHRLASAFTVFGGLRIPRCMNGFWHRLRTILIRNGLLETVANQQHQEFRGKGNAVIRSPTRHHVERASDVLPSVQPRCFALQRPLFKRGWRCYAVQGRYVEKGAGIFGGRGGGGHIRVLAVSTPRHNLRSPPSQQAWARDVGVSQKEPIVGVPHRDCPSHPAAISSMFAASCGHRYGPIETNRKIWQCHLALPPPSLAARTQGGPIRSIRGVCTLKAH